MALFLSPTKFFDCKSVMIMCQNKIAFQSTCVTIVVFNKFVFWYVMTTASLLKLVR
jgi:hypothetical protein